MKRVISAILAFAILFCMIPAPWNDPVHAAAPADSTVIDSWDGKAATSFASGDGSQDSPYVVRTAEQLAYLAQVVNSGTFGSAHVMLANQIDLSGYNWTPIGTTHTNSFNGTFEGNGYTISGLQLTNASGNLSGLFGCATGEIRNLNLEVYNFSATYNSGTAHFGAVAAYNTGTISDVEVSGKITAKNTSNTTVQIYCGGIAGVNTGTIRRSSYYGNITASSHGGARVGGIAGSNTGTIETTYSMGSVTVSKTASSDSYTYTLAGGIAGGNAKSIAYCYSTMTVNSTIGSYNNSNAIAGGLVGEATDDAATVTKCYAQGAVTASSSGGKTSTAGGLIGYARGTIVSSYAMNDVSATANNQAASTAGRIYGGNTCVIGSTYYSSNYKLKRTESYTDTRTEGEGCNAKEVEYTAYRETSNQSNSGYTNTFTYSQSFITNTLKWGTYTNMTGVATDPNKVWVIGADRPHLYTEYIYSLTIPYHFGDRIDRISFSWLEKNQSIDITAPEIIGYTRITPASVSLTITEDTIFDVKYSKNEYTITVELYSTNGKNLGTFTQPCYYSDPYSITLPEKVGYTSQVETLEGVMPAENITLKAYYEPNVYTLTIEYVYNDTNETAAETKQFQVAFGEIYNVTSPEIKGYNTTQNVVSGAMPASDQTVTVYYGTNFYQITVIHQYENGQAFYTDTHTLPYGKDFSFAAQNKTGYTPSQEAVSGIVRDDATYVITYTLNSYNLTIHYVDKYGNQLAPSYTDTLYYGEKFQVDSPVITGYTPSQETLSGIMRDHDEIISIVYGKEMYPVTITYQYSDGTLIRESQNNVEYNTLYDIPSPTIPYYTPDISSVTGTMLRSPVYVTVTYTRNVLGSGSCGDEMNWILYEDGIMEISGQGAMYDYAADCAPWNGLNDKIKTLSVAEGITSIGDNAFAQCLFLETVSLPDSLTAIGDKAFFGCSRLFTFSIPKNVSVIGGGAFSYCERISLYVDAENSHFVVDGGVLFNASKDTLLTYPINLYSNSYTVPAGVTTIAPYAFFANPYLRTVTLPDTLTRIGASAFESTWYISKVHIPSAVIAIEANAFRDTVLSSLIIDGNITELGDNAFASGKLRSVYFKAGVPANVGTYVFGSDLITLEQLCLYYPLANEDWLTAITTASDESGYKREYWQAYHAYAYNGVGDVTLENIGQMQVYAIFVYCDKTPMADVSVTFNGETKKTDKDGFVYFTYRNLTEAELQIHKDHYVSSCEISTAHKLDPMGVEYFNLTTHSDVNGLSCYGNDISTDIAYINVKYEGSIPIIVKGNTEFNITKMELFQIVPDAEDPENGYIKKVLQTVSQGDENLYSDGHCQFLVKASAFSYSPDEEYPIYVRMYTDSGENAIEKKLRIKTNSFKLTFDFSNLFGDVNMSLGDTGVPFLDGMKLNLKTPAECPLSFKVINNEVYIAWGLDGLLDKALEHIKTEAEGTSSNLKKDIENTNTRIKNYMTKMSYEADEKINKNKLLKTKHTPNFSLETDLAGGVCFCVGEANDLQRIETYVKLSVELKASWTADYIFLLFIPVTLEIKASASGEIELSNIGYDLQHSEFLVPEATLSLEASLQVSLGLGCRVISAGVFARLRLTAALTIGEVSYFDGLVLSGDWGFYAKLDVGLFSLYAEKSWQFMEVELIPKSASARMFSAPDANGYIGQYKGLAVYELSSYAAQSRSVDVGDVNWSTDLSTDIELNAYEYAKPQLIECGNTTMVMYITTCDDRSDNNAQAIVYRVYDKATSKWSEAVMVNDNGTSDSSFALTTYNGTVYVVYAEADKVFTDTDVAGKTDQQVMVDISLAQEVVVAAYNPQTQQFETVKTLTDNSYFDASPVIEAIDGKLYVAWTTNYADDESLVFGMNGENDVNLCCFDGSTWTEPECIISGCSPVAEMILTELDGKVHVAMIIDEDASYYTSDDNNIYIADAEGNITFIDCYGEMIGNLCSARYKGEAMLTWYCGGGLKKLTSVAEDPQILLEAGSGITPDYRLVSLADDILALTWCLKGIKENEESSEKSMVYMTLMDDSGEWTQKALAFQAPHYMMSYDLVGHDGDMRFAYINTIMSSDADNNLTMNSKLCSFFLTTGYDLEVGEVTNINVDVATGKISLDVELANNGVKTVKQISVILLEKNAYCEAIKYHAIGLYQLELVSGEVENLHLEANIIENIDLDNSLVIINTFDGTEEAFLNYVGILNDTLIWDDSDSGGDSFVSGGVGGTTVIKPAVGGGIRPPADIVRPDLKVEGNYVIIGETEYLSIKVSNIGSDIAYGVLNVVKQSADGNGAPVSVYTANITSLAPYGIKYYLVELKQDLFENTYETFDCWLSYCDGFDIESNNRISITAVKMDVDSGTQRDNNAVASQLSSYNQEFDKYASEDLELSITLNGNRFVGLRDEEMNENAVYTENEDGTVLNMTVSKDYLKTLEEGYYEHVFLFLTECGYIDCTLNLTIVDNTPIDLSGDVSILGTPQRGEVLSVDISNLNTDEVTYSWTLDGEEVSTAAEYTITNRELGKYLTVTVSGAGLYRGSFTTGVYIHKVSRTINAPKVSALGSDDTVQVKKGFIVGDGTVEYGWATENDPNKVAQWSTDNTVTFQWDDLYYLFVRVTGSEIYQDAVSEATFYTNKDVVVKIAKVNLRSDCAGLYFTGSFDIKEGVQVARMGIAVSLYSELPTADGSDPTSMWTQGSTSVLIANILGEGNTGAENNRRAAMPIYARAYVELADGTYIYSDAVCVNLRAMVEAVDTKWDNLTDAQKAAFSAMCTKFKNPINLWKTPNVKRHYAS